LTLRQLPLDDKGWHQFVHGRADATPFHDPAWASLLAECYRLQGFVLAQTDLNGSITAGIPLLAPPRLLQRERRLVSLPYTDALQPLVSDRDARLFAGAVDVVRRELGVARIELRGGLDGAQPAPVTAFTHDLELAADPEVLARRFSQNRRRRIRIAERSSLQVRRAEAERDLTQSFFGLHLQTRRRLGVPSQPKRFFRLLWRRIIEPGRGVVLIVEQSREPVASAVFLMGNGTMVYKYGASDPSRLEDGPNDLVMWAALREACERGFHRFDFGRSDASGTGLRRFKSSWGAEEAPLVYATIGGRVRSDGSSAGELLGRVLRRSPTWLTRAIGEAGYRYAG
jgi:CelD/BcsL family acetyltransferase involved in cellulose biosynthesis